MAKKSGIKPSGRRPAIPPNKRHKSKKDYKRNNKVDPNVEDESYEEIEFNCPVRGKVKQKVKVKKLKAREYDDTQIIGAKDPNAEIEERDDGLSIFTEEELGKDDA
jgi:hypothetical protein